MRGGLVIVAHRGASALAPENTLAAFQAALDLGVDVIGTDVRAGRDGALMLSHDASLARRAGRPEEIADLDGATLGRVVVGTAATGREHYLPTLDELFRLVAGRAGVLLDLKVPPGHEAGMLAAIRAAGAEGATIVGVRSVAALAVWRALAPGVRTLALGRTPGEVWAMAGTGGRHGAAVVAVGGGRRARPGARTRQAGMGDVRRSGDGRGGGGDGGGASRVSAAGGGGGDAQ